jgi:hypothetical protein
MPKKFLLSLLFTTIIYADCSQKPSADKVAKAIESKKYDQAREFLTVFETEVKEYEKKCDTSKEMYEELNVMVLEYEDHLSDLNEDMHKKSVSTDCSIVPSSNKLEEAFKVKDDAIISSLYPQYKKESNEYISNCASQSSYEEVYEASMLCEERYNEWKKSH